MIFVEPITLTARGIMLEPLELHHEPGLRAAAADGELWNLRVTSVPAPDETRGYIDAALQAVVPELQRLEPVTEHHSDYRAGRRSQRISQCRQSGMQAEVILAQARAKILAGREYGKRLPGGGDGRGRGRGGEYVWPARIADKAEHG